MPIEYKGSAIPTSFATCSLRCEPHRTLKDKLGAIKKAGFDGIELAMPDVIAYGKVIDGKEPLADDYDALARVGKEIKTLTTSLGLRILMLQPFANFEGWTVGKFDREREDAFTRARGWIKVMEAVGTDMLQVGSSDAEGISPFTNDLAADLGDLADMLAQKGFRLAYENWCWATHAPDWKHVWNIVRNSKRPNIGLCLDTFQSAGGEYGDPTTSTGIVEGPGAGTEDEQKDVEERWRRSLKELVENVSSDQVYLLQISDAYRMDPPLAAGKDDRGLRPRARWSHDYRPIPGEGGYLPIQAFLEAVLKTGFRSWLSMEVFDQKSETGVTMEEYTERAMRSLTNMLSSAKRSSFCR